VPLPPRGFGAVQFTDVWLSLAYDDFGQGSPTASGRVRIISLPTGTVTSDQPFTIPIGRTVVAHINDDALTASVITDPDPVTNRAPAVTALVEYTTP
jgi:hypothetical protein